LKKNFVRGITIAHNIIIVDLGKESSLPLKYLKSPITKEKKEKKVYEREIFVQRKRFKNDRWIRFLA